MVNDSSPSCTAVRHTTVDLRVVLCVHFTYLQLVSEHACVYLVIFPQAARTAAVIRDH